MGIKVLIGDDHKIFRQGLRSLLEKEPDIEVIGEAEDGRTIVRMCEDLSPDVVIIDISMPDLNGIEATRQILAGGSSVKVIALSMYSDRRFISGIMKVGASGYLLKDCASDELIQSIRNLDLNKFYLSRSVINVVIEDYIRRLQKEDISIFNVLTSREREMLQLLAEGKNTREIADQLSVSVKTIETHRQAVMRKLNIHTVAELTKYAIREGLTYL